MYQKAKITTGALGVGVAVAALSALVFGVYKSDRNTVQQWNALTNAIPEMIIKGERDRAREIYEDTWREINQRIRDAGRDPVSFIYQSDIKTLENTFTWDALVTKARQKDKVSSYEMRELKKPGYDIRELKKIR